MGSPQQNKKEMVVVVGGKKDLDCKVDEQVVWNSVVVAVAWKSIR